jgi:phosphoribosylformimino-5-aminoimidazole carboxamide ribotide isomerase
MDNFAWHGVSLVEYRFALVWVYGNRRDFRRSLGPFVESGGSSLAFTAKLVTMRSEALGVVSDRRKTMRFAKQRHFRMVIYPAIDLLNGQCVRLRQGDYSQETVFSSDPAAVAQRWVDLGADRLHLVDLDGAKAGRPINGEVIRAIVTSVRVPCQLGGGIRTDADLETVFGWGVRWAVLGTRALQDPAWVIRMAERYPQRIVLGVDARNGYVATEGWLSTSSTKATELAQQVAHAPLAAVVYTDIAKDGMMSGPNFDALAEMQAAMPLPVIASGGVCEPNHVARLRAMTLHGAIIGRALYEGTIDLASVVVKPA